MKAGCRLRWLLDNDAQKADALRSELGADACAATFNDLCTDPELDVVVIASFDHDHFEQAIEGLKYGKHLFIEKPLCRSAAELQTLRRAWQAAGRPHLKSNLVLRAAPIYRWLREAIHRGDLGRIYAFDGDYLFGRLQKITEGWRGSVEDYSVMQGGGIHLLDLMLWLTGESPRTVSAVGNRLCTQNTAFRYNDFVAATYGFESGMVGRITANFGCVHRHQHVMRVFGTEATFILDDRGPRLHRCRDPEIKAEALHIETLPEHKGDLIPEFLQSIRTGADSELAARHEFDLISACVAVDEALKANQTVEIRYS